MQKSSSTTCRVPLWDPVISVKRGHMETRYSGKKRWKKLKIGGGDGKLLENCGKMKKGKIMEIAAK